MSTDTKAFASREYTAAEMAARGIGPWKMDPERSISDLLARVSITESAAIVDLLARVRVLESAVSQLQQKVLEAAS